MMKKLIIVAIVATTLCSFKEPEKIKWYSLGEGLELSRKENKPILLFVYVGWCDMCQRMEKKVFNNKGIQPLITSSFIAVKLNPEVDSAYFRSDKLLDRKIFLKEIEPGKLAVSVPTTVFYQGKDVQPMTMNGVLDPEEFRDSIKQFLEK